MRISILASGLLLAAASAFGGLWVWQRLVAPAVTAKTSLSAAATELDGTATPLPAPSSGTSPDPASCDVVYYRHPMGLPDISYEPKKDNMGMDYIAVCAEGADASFIIPPGRQQMLGVTLIKVQRQDLVRQIDATGLVTLNQRTVSVVAPRVEGWIEELLVDAVGDQVVRGTPLARVYSPELIQMQVNYRVAIQDGTAKAEGLAERLRLLGIADSEIARLSKGGEVAQTAVLVAPHDGTVIQKMAKDGMYFAAGTPLLEIADLTVVWVIAEVYERDVSLISPGVPVEVVVETYPDRSFAGTVQSILPEIMLDTRTAQVRIELANAEGLLLPGMFARVRLQAPTAIGALVVPRSTVLDADGTQVVLVALGQGRFEARAVVMGAAADGMIQIMEGLQGGEELVESAAFLIDAESNIRAALQSLAPPAPAKVTSPASQTP